MKKMQVLFLVLVLWAPQAVMGARPLSTEDAATATPGSYEMEAGYSFLKDSESSEESGLEFLLKHGITKKFDISIAVPYGIDPDDELGGIEVGMKFFLFSLAGADAAFVAGLQPGQEEYSLTGVLSREAGAFAVHLNLGYTGPAQNGAASYAVAAEYALGERTMLGGEIAGDDDDQTEGMLGINFRVCEGITIDAGIGAGLNSESAKNIFSSGITCEF